MNEPQSMYLEQVDVEDADVTSPLYVYVWEDEADEKEDELMETVSELRNEYIFATGIVYAEELRDLVPLGSAELTAYAWSVRLNLFDENVDDSDDARELLNEVSRQL
jgi:hypothetical protein